MSSSKWTRTLFKNNLSININRLCRTNTVFSIHQLHALGTMVYSIPSPFQRIIVERTSTRWKSDDTQKYSSSQRLSFPRNSSLFQRVDILLSTPLGELHPQDLKYTSIHILRDCCKMKSFEGMEKALLILHKLLDEKKKKNENIFQNNCTISQLQLTCIPRYVFHTCMYGYAQIASKNKTAIEQSKRLLKQMWDEHAYDNQQQERWKQIFNESSFSASQNTSSCRPSLHDYNTLLVTLAHGTKWDTKRIPKDAETIVTKTMIDLSQNYSDLFPDTTSFNHVIQCYANCGTYHAGHSAQSLLDIMKQRSIKPNVRSYTGVITAFANSHGHESSLKAQDVLFDFIKMNRSQVPKISEKNDASFMTLNPEQDSEMNHNLDSLEPDHVMFTSCIQAWVNAAKNYGRSPKARFEAAQHAEGILKLMYELAAQWDEDHPLQPDSQRKNPFLPDRVTWNTVLTGWAKSDTKEAAPRAQLLLDEMMNLSKKYVVTTPDNDGVIETSILPDRTSFHLVMDAWARYSKYDHDSAEKSESLLKQMYDLYHSGRFPDSIKPNSMTYISAMKAWARSENSSKVQYCQTLLDTMIGKFEAGEEEMKPNIVAYTTILNAIVHTSTTEVDPLLSIALKTYRDILNDPNDLGLKPDKIVFATMMQIFKTHLKHSGEPYRMRTDQILNDARRHGVVL